MDQLEKLKFIQDVFDYTRNDIVDAISSMPEEWDGYELRQYILDKIEERVNYIRMNRRSKRWKDYRNECITNPKL